MRTPLCDLLGIELPIVQAPLGSAAVPRLAAAVSDAGALGMVSITWSDDPERAVADTGALTGRPFGVNVVIDVDRHARLAAALAGGARIVSTVWGDPSPYVDAVHAAGALLLHTVGSPDEARAAVEAGADAVVAQGWEAGGHVWGGIATLPLVPQVVDAVGPVPVVAAGGIGDGRGVAAALALGAAGAWVGTRFLLAEETPIHDEYRRRVLEGRAEDALWFADLYDVGWPDAPHRALRNSTSDAWEAAGRPASGKRPGEGDEVARRADGSPIVRYSSSLPTDALSGEIEALSLWAGQSVGLARRVQPAAEIVRELVAEADAAIRRVRP